MELKRENPGEEVDFLDDGLKCFIIFILPKATPSRHGLISLFGVCTTLPSNVCKQPLVTTLTTHINLKWHTMQISFWNVVLGRDHWLLHSHERPPPVSSH